MYTSTIDLKVTLLEFQYFLLLPYFIHYIHTLFHKAFITNYFLKTFVDVPN